MVTDVYSGHPQTKEGQFSQCIINTRNTIARIAGFPDFYTLPHTATPYFNINMCLGIQTDTSASHKLTNIKMEVKTPLLDLDLPCGCTKSKAYFHWATHTMITWENLSSNLESCHFFPSKKIFILSDSLSTTDVQVCHWFQKVNPPQSKASKSESAISKSKLL